MIQSKDNFFEDELLILDNLKKAGIDPYPIYSRILNNIEEIKKDYSSYEGKIVIVAGRVLTKREHGKASFATILGGGTNIQLYLKIDNLGEENYSLFKKFINVGDFIAVEGVVFKTHTGEITVSAQNIKLLSKALLPLPEKWHGIENPEVRYRQRYLDLIINEDARKTFETRTKIILTIRKTLENLGFMEVETPILQEIYGGAIAKPFITHHNALNEDLYLRIAPELYLKRLIIGGFEKVFEIGKAFRNEGISIQHNPEFTILELYEAYTDYKRMMEITEIIFDALISEVIKTSKIEYKGKIIEFKFPFKRLKLSEAFLLYANVDMNELKDLDFAKNYLAKENITINKKLSWESIVDEILKKKVEPELIQPTFLYDYPLLLSPLAKKKTENPELVERFQPIIGGLEIGNAFTELNDPVDQFDRFALQEEARKGGDLEAHTFDRNYIEAMKFGMPPTGGLGLGIDRIIMLLTGKESIREVIFFPQLRKKE